MGQKANPKSVRLLHYPELFELGKQESSDLVYLKSYIVQFFRQKGIYISKLSILGVRKVVLKVRKLDCNMEVNQLVTYWSQVKKTLTFKRAAFASDLIQSSILLLNNQATAYLLNTFLVLMFTRLPKRQHSRFFVFLKKFFKGILSHSQSFNGSILGMRLLISGKLSGKTRAQSFAVNVGQVPTQTLDCKIDYSFVPAFTMMGTFGFKLWIATK